MVLSKPNVTLSSSKKDNRIGSKEELDKPRESPWGQLIENRNGFGI